MYVPSQPLHRHTITCVAQGRRGTQEGFLYLDDSHVTLKYALPMAEVVTDFYDELKSQSSGYARCVGLCPACVQHAF